MSWRTPRRAECQTRLESAAWHNSRMDRKERKIMIDYNRIIDTLYPEAGKLRDILVIHSRKVADKALDIIRKNGIQEVDPKFVEAAAMLHDIGIRRCDAPRIECHGTSPYLCHGIIGGAMLRDNCQLWGMTPAEIEPYARVCERHTGTGLTMRQIEERNLPLPHRDFVPETLEEQIICYADKFYSKTHLEREKTYAHVLRSLSDFGDDVQRKFIEWHTRFGG